MNTIRILNKYKPLTLLGSLLLSNSPTAAEGRTLVDIKQCIDQPALEVCERAYNDLLGHKAKPRNNALSNAKRACDADNKKIGACYLSSLETSSIENETTYLSRACKYGYFPACLIIGKQFQFAKDLDGALEYFKHSCIKSEIHLRKHRSMTAMQVHINSCYEYSNTLLTLGKKGKAHRYYKKLCKLKHIPSCAYIQGKKNENLILKKKTKAMKKTHSRRSLARYLNLTSSSKLIWTVLIFIVFLVVLVAALFSIKKTNKSEIEEYLSDDLDDQTSKEVIKIFSSSNTPQRQRIISTVLNKLSRKQKRK